MTELAYLIEAVLFYQAEPITVKKLTVLFKREETEIREALKMLEDRLGATGLRLIVLHDEVTLGTAPEASAFIAAITKEELSKDLSKASLETLAIVLYKGPITRAEIDYIRGVNSTFILRNLLVRGLIEKVDNPHDQRSFLYRPTFQLLEFMGATSVAELPEYEATMVALAQFVTAKEESEDQKEHTETTAPETNEQVEPAVIPDPDEDTPLDSPLFGTDEDGGFSDEMDAGIFNEDDAPSVDADIAETDEAGPSFVDNTLLRHLRDDERRAS